MNSSATPRVIDTEILLEAPRCVVWSCLTQADELTRWFPLDARVEAGDGGTIWMSWRNEFQFTSRIVAWEPEHRLRLVPQSASGEDDLSSGMEFLLEERGKATQLRVVHRGFPDGPEGSEIYDSCARGWVFTLWGLRHYLENFRGMPRVVAYARAITETLTREEAWTLVMGSGGLDPKGSLVRLAAGDIFTLWPGSTAELVGRVRALIPPKDLVAIVENFGRAPFRIHIDTDPRRRDLYLWLSTYGVDEPRVKALQDHWVVMLESVFGEHARIWGCPR